MPHVSSKKLKRKFLGKLFGKLLSVLEKAQGKQNLSLVLNELFTRTEKIMFAKRLAIVLMLANNTPQHRIAEILKVSPTTVTKISLGIEIGKYEFIIKISKREKFDFEKLVWNILTAGGIMPPKIRGKYWRKYSKKL